MAWVCCKVTVVEVLDHDWYPGLCKAVLTDSEGVEHTFVEKLPVVGLEEVKVSDLPLQKSIRVEIVKDMGDRVEITTERPDSIEAEDGTTHFVVPKESLEMLADD